MRTTRRDFVLGVSTLALAAALSATPLFSPSFAQTVAQAELLKAGPLGEQAMGSDKAPVTIIEYASMTCSHCAHFTLTTFPQLKEKYIDTGKVRFIFREFPFDPIAAGAFMLARCAPEDKYFDMAGLFFETQEAWHVSENQTDALFGVVKQAGFTRESFETCLKDQTLLDGITATRSRASDKFKVNATPTFFINGKRADRFQSIPDVDQTLSALVKS